jgi:hypothetical protein
MFGLRALLRRKTESVTVNEIVKEAEPDLPTEMIDTAEANIREDHRSGKTSKKQFQKEMLIIARARHHAREGAEA